MSNSYRLTLYENGLIDRMLPFEASTVGEAISFADSNRYGRHAVLSNAAGMVKMYPSDAVRDMLGSFRRPIQ